jgi:hypothetical protein
MHVRFVPPGWNSGAIRRSRAAESADVMLALGGGEGVEHLAGEFLRRARPVIPLDLQVMGSTGDGTGGAGRLLREYLSAARPPYVLRDGSSPVSLLSRLLLKERQLEPVAVAAHVADILSQLQSPRAFFVRLLAADDPNFTAVEAYFRNVVDPVVADLGFEKFEMGDHAESRSLDEPGNLQAPGRVHHGRRGYHEPSLQLRHRARFCAGPEQKDYPDREGTEPGSCN